MSLLGSGYGTSSAYGDGAYKGVATLTGSLQGLSNSEYRRCLHLGLKTEQGLWWSEVSDGDWVWPESQGCVCDLFDDDGQSNLVVWDERSGLPYTINPREGPVNSRVKQTFRDKKDFNAVTDLSTAVPGTVKLAGHRRKVFIGCPE